MKTINVFPIAGVITLLLAACSPIFYSPPSQHVPLLTHEKEFTATGSYVSGGSDGYALKAAYALSPHMALLGSVNGVILPSNKDKDGRSGSGGIVDMGAGYYTPFSRKFVFETYGFLGFGWMKNSFPGSVSRHPGTDGKISAGLFNVAVQPSIGYKSKYFEAALSSKMGLVSYYGIKGKLVEMNSDQIIEGNQQEYLKANKNQFMIEPALTLSGGWEFLKIQAQFGFSANITNALFPQETSWISIGLSYRTPRKK